MLLLVYRIDLYDVSVDWHYCIPQVLLGLELSLCRAFFWGLDILILRAQAVLGQAAVYHARGVVCDTVTVDVILV